MENRSVGLEAWGVYIPKERHTSEYISKETGIPKNIIEEKFGLLGKTVPGPEDHTVQMGANASFQALKRANITPEDLDVIIWAGEVYAERPMVVNGIKLQQLLGNPMNSWAFDVNQRCGTFLVGMLVAKSLIQTDPNINRILVASGYRNCDLINYKNPRSRFMISLAASGVAAIIRADYKRNEILGISAISDGRFADDVYIPAGGTIQPITSKALDDGLLYLDVPDSEGLKDRLDKYSMDSFVRVIDKALAQSGYTREDINYLALLHMKRSAFEYVAKTVGVDPYTQSTYFEDIGHNGQNDGIISIEYGIRDGKIKNGDLIVIVSAGIGWAWNAGVIRWGSSD
ncbi:MAG: 3-oxoacyl-ACP synthase [Candidatus Lokiarchaeota archaeon]|nr:3-oxoacyl-ACP synthase [Candidatus Lokiarchaeota archaeon]